MAEMVRDDRDKETCENLIARTTILIASARVHHEEGRPIGFARRPPNFSVRTCPLLD
jgi:hypothetical protein